MSSELIETERASAGSLLTTRQQRLLPLQLFHPLVGCAGRVCGQSNLRGCSLHHSREAANKGNATGTSSTKASPQSIPHLTWPEGGFNQTKPKVLCPNFKQEDPKWTGAVWTRRSCGWQSSGPCVLLPKEAQCAGPSQRFKPYEFTKPPTLPLPSIY